MSDGTGGYRTPSSPYINSLRRFNEAVALQPRILGQFPRECHHSCASMRPWPCSHGYLVHEQRATAAHVASMRPWPCSHGYASQYGASGGGKPASMRPWPCSHGYDIMDPNEALADDRFNEAVALQPRIHRRRSHSRRGHGGFNEAVALQPRIPAAIKRPTFRGLASMRPWPCSHGYSFRSIIQFSKNLLIRLRAVASIHCHGPHSPSRVGGYVADLVGPRAPRGFPEGGTARKPPTKYLHTLLGWHSVAFASAP